MIRLSSGWDHSCEIISEKLVSEIECFVHSTFHMHANDFKALHVGAQQNSGVHLRNQYLEVAW